MINVRTIKKLKNNEGVTLRNGNKVNFKRGYQVGLHGCECLTAKDTMDMIRYCGFKDCGVWLSNGIYYLDITKHVMSKSKALEIGKAHNQQCIYDWHNNKCIDC